MATRLVRPPRITRLEAVLLSLLEVEHCHVLIQLKMQLAAGPPSTATVNIAARDHKKGFVESSRRVQIPKSCADQAPYPLSAY